MVRSLIFFAIVALSIFVVVPKIFRVSLRSVEVVIFDDWECRAVVRSKTTSFFQSGTEEYLWVGCYGENPIYIAATMFKAAKITYVHPLDRGVSGFDFEMRKLPAGYRIHYCPNAFSEKYDFSGFSSAIYGKGSEIELFADSDMCR